MAVSNQDPACFLPRVLFDRQGSLILGSFVFRRRMSSHGFVGLPVLFLLPISIVFRRCSVFLRPAWSRGFYGLSQRRLRMQRDGLGEIICLVILLRLTLLVKCAPPTAPPP